MSSVQERLQLKRLPLDKWSTREKLCLASAVQSSGDQNWMSVSRSLKMLCGDRPPDWFSQKSCAVQYAKLLENVETPKRKKRTASERDSSTTTVETPSESILRKLTQERIAELKKIIQEESQLYTKIKEDVILIHSGVADEKKLREMWQQIEIEEAQKEKEKLAHEQWLKEREEKKRELERAWRPFDHHGSPNRSPSQKNLNLNVKVKTEEMETEDASSQQGNKSGTSPLLTSLLKSPPPVPNQSGTSSTMIQSSSQTLSSPTITNLLTGGTQMSQQKSLNTNISTQNSFDASEISDFLAQNISFPIGGGSSSALSVETMKSAQQTAPTLTKLLDVKTDISNLIKNEIKQEIIDSAMQHQPHSIAGPSNQGKQDQNDDKFEIMDTDVDNVGDAKELMEVFQGLIPDNIDEFNDIASILGEDGILGDGIIDDENVLKNDSADPSPTQPKPHSEEDDSNQNSSSSGDGDAPEEKKVKLQLDSLSIISPKKLIEQHIPEPKIEEEKKSLAESKFDELKEEEEREKKEKQLQRELQLQQQQQQQLQLQQEQQHQQQLLLQQQKNEEIIPIDDSSSNSPVTIDLPKSVEEHKEPESSVEKPEVKNESDNDENGATESAVHAEDDTIVLSDDSPKNSQQMTQKIINVIEDVGKMIDENDSEDDNKPLIEIKEEIQIEDSTDENSSPDDVEMKTAEKNLDEEKSAEKINDVENQDSNEKVEPLPVDEVLTKDDKNHSDEEVFEDAKESLDESAGKATTILIEKKPSDLEGVLDIDDDSLIEVIKEDKVGKAKRDYSRKKLDEMRKEDSPAKADEDRNDGSESPLTIEDDASEKMKRRYSSTPVLDSIPSSPASIDHDREYKAWKKQILTIHHRLTLIKHAANFLRPIEDPVIAAEYKNFIYRPMDLQTIKKNVENGTIRTTAEFQRDIMLMCQNAVMYSRKLDSGISVSAREMMQESVQIIETGMEMFKSSSSVIKEKDDKSTSSSGSSSASKRSGRKGQPRISGVVKI
uniref:Putative mitochondrion n=1 Tax=Corethrella appendiculata TaxID=1370023 RepID=U5ET45_9DIPT